MNEMDFRIEKDLLGKKRVPKDAYYGIHTVRSIENFKISRLRAQPELIRAIVFIKKACAKANLKLRLLDYKKAKAIINACDDIINGKIDFGEFPLDIFQSGSGTSLNMNVNEVIANRAIEILGGKRGDKTCIHPNDDVNKGQSTNNVIPSSIKIASYMLLIELIKSVNNLKEALRRKEKEFKDVIKSARTHLQDAVPITLGQEFGAYATAISKDIVRLRMTKESLISLGIGGNAVGTGLNTYSDFRRLIIKYLNSIVKLDFKVSKDGIETTQFLTDLAYLSSNLKLLAIDLNKICNDLRLLSSGPKTGLNEIILPAVEPGSSIMPGKINPSICEAVNMVCYQVMGNDLTITCASGAGQLDLNTHIPVIGYNLIESLQILNKGISRLTERCIKGIKANKKQCRYYAEHSLGLITALSPVVGYDKAADIVKEVLKTKKTIREVIIEKGYLTEEEVRKYLDLKSLTGPNLKNKIDKSPSLKNKENYNAEGRFKSKR